MRMSVMWLSEDLLCVGARGWGDQTGTRTTAAQLQKRNIFYLSVMRARLFAA